MWPLGTGLFRRRHVFKVHPHCSLCQHCIPLYGRRRTPLCGWTTVCLSVHQRMDVQVVFMLLATASDAAMSVGAQAFARTYTVISLGHPPGSGMTTLWLTF